MFDVDGIRIAVGDEVEYIEAPFEGVYRVSETRQDGLEIRNKQWARWVRPFQIRVIKKQEKQI